METLILKDIEFRPDKEALMKRLHLDESFEEEFDDILAEAVQVAKPRPWCACWRWRWRARAR